MWISVGAQVNGFSTFGGSNDPNFSWEVVELVLGINPCKIEEVFQFEDLLGLDYLFQRNHTIAALKLPPLPPNLTSRWEMGPPRPLGCCVPPPLATTPCVIGLMLGPKHEFWIWLGTPPSEMTEPTTIVTSAILPVASWLMMSPLTISTPNLLVIHNARIWLSWICGWRGIHWLTWPWLMIHQLVALHWEQSFADPC